MSVSTPTTFTEPTQSTFWRLWRQAYKPMSTIAWYAVMIVVSLIVLIPIILVILGSFKTVNEFFSTPYGLPKAWDFFNYKKAWNTADLQHAALNSLISTFFGVLFSTILACLASYGLARFVFRANSPDQCAEGASGRAALAAATFFLCALRDSMFSDSTASEKAIAA